MSMELTTIIRDRARRPAGFHPSGPRNESHLRDNREELIPHIVGILGDSIAGNPGKLPINSHSPGSNGREALAALL